MKKQLFTAICLCLCLLYQGTLLATTEILCDIIYVKKDATGNNDGSSWTNAYTKLQDALLTGCACGGTTQIWVAAGTYYPDEGTGQTNNLRTSSFQLCNNKVVYGGFNGTETALSQRNWITNITTLSGDIDQTPANTTGNAYHVVNASGTNNSAALDGFTITLGNANGTDPFNKGGGVYKDNGGAKFYNNKFLANNAAVGGGMFNLGGSIDIVKCIFENNTASVATAAAGNNGAMTGTYKDCSFINNTTGIDQGGVGCQGVTLTFDNCAFIGNLVTGGSGAGGAFHAWASNITMKNTLFSGNKANRGGAIFVTFNTTIKLINVTGSGNWATANGGFIFGETNSNFLIDNTVVWNNRAGTVTTSTSASVFHSGSTATIKYSDIANSGGSGAWNAAIGTNGGNNIDANPQFVLPVNPASAPTTAGNLQLTGFSPLNLGSNAAYDVVGDPQNDLDLANSPRVFDYSNSGIIDMGAYEFQGQSTCPGGSIVYVKASASGANNGSSWANAYTKLQDALLIACTCTGITQIWVAAGTYYPDEGNGQTNNLRTSSFQLCNNKVLYGGFNGTETTLSQRDWQANVTTLSGDIDQVAGATNNAYHVLIGSGTGNSATLDGFTVAGGNANGGGANNNGGGMVNLSGSPTLRNMKFTGNQATTLGGAMHNSQSSPIIQNSTFLTNTSSLVGGAINAEVSSHMTVVDCDFISNTGNINGGAISLSQSNPVIRDCRFIGNTSQEGGGIYAFRMVSTITNCLFSGNRATNRGAGLHLYTESNSILVNCVISGNMATGDGGGILIWNTSNLTLVNSIIHNNKAVGLTTSTSASIFRDNSGAYFSYSLVANSGGSGNWNAAIGINGGNNVDVNPQFVLPVDPSTAPTPSGDLHLQPSSSAINAGNNTANTQPFDLDGNPRIANYVIDMGAFEHFIACTPLTWYVDADADGYGDPDFSLDSCGLPSGYVDNNLDCDDTSGDIHPNAEETCNDIDDDCDGLIDEDLPMYTYYQDADADGYGNEMVFITSCDTVPQEGYVTGYGNGPFGGGDGEGGGGDGGGGEGDGGGDGENYFDSDDTNPLVNPGMPEICNGIDDDSDGLTDEGVMSVFYADADGDTYGNLAVDTMACTAPFGFVANGQDCDDTNPNVNPGTQESCNGVDDDCDGLVDDADQGVIDQGIWYADVDQDGYGNPADSVFSCLQPSGYIDNNEDCDDTNADIHPGAEICNGLDDDCDGLVDDGLSCQGPDGDGDGIEDEEDNCLSIENPNQEDSDCDDVGDACDVCPGGDDGVDMNNDGLPDCHYLPAFADILSSWKCSANKVFIAHHSGGGWNTLCVSYNAAQAHINHGDYLGPVSNSHCSQNFMMPGFEHHELDESNATLELFPNPVSDEVTIHLHDVKGWSELVVADQLGRILFKKVLQPGDDVVKLDVRSVEFNSGIYSAIVNYGSGVLVNRFVVTR